MHPFGIKLCWSYNNLMFIQSMNTRNEYDSRDLIKLQHLIKYLV